MCTLRPNTMIQMPTVATAYGLHAWFVAFNDAQILPKQLDELFVALMALAAGSKQTLHGRLMGPMQERHRHLDSTICGVAACGLGCVGGCGIPRAILMVAEWRETLMWMPLTGISVLLLH